jgi:hypothetical protein
MLLPILGIYNLGITGCRGMKLMSNFVRFRSVFIQLHRAHPFKPSCSEQRERDDGNLLLTADKENIRYFC